MKTEFKSINPVYAEHPLKSNPMNRLINDLKVNNYSRQMAAGLWKEETGEAIKIAFDGSLLDGQHRLVALIKANKTLRFLLITGLEKEIFSVLDSGKPRSAGDVFYIAGVTNATNVAASIRRYLGLKAGNIGGRNAHNYSSSEFLSQYRGRSKFWDAAISMGSKWYNDSKRLLSLSELTGMYAFFYDINDDDAFSFFTKFSNGIGLENDDPIYRLRDKLLFAKINTRFNMIQTVRSAIIIKAWNHTRAGRKIKILKFDIERDEFPVAI